MIKHIVLFKLTSNNSENIERAISALRGMEEKIESLQSLEIGVNFIKSERSYDIALIAVFKDKEGLEFYANHPAHIPIKELMFSICSSSAVVDYESFEKKTIRGKKRK